MAAYFDGTLDETHVSEEAGLDRPRSQFGIQLHDVQLPKFGSKDAALILLGSFQASLLCF